MERVTDRTIIEAAFTAAYRNPQLPIVCPWGCEKSVFGSQFNTHALDAHGEPTPKMETIVVHREARVDMRSAWIQTFTGKAFEPLDPQVEDICIEDIAHSLACMNRFTGHTRIPYSVAQHSVLASVHIRDLYGVSVRMQLATLMHDGSEAYLVDVPKPIKSHLVGYEEIETRVQYAIGQKFGLDMLDFNHPLVKEVDFRMLATEKRDLLGPEPRSWGKLIEPFEEVIVPMGWQEAEAAFLARFKELT